MPSLQQLNDSQLQDPAKLAKKSTYRLLLKALAVVLLIVAWKIYDMMPKTSKIPAEILSVSQNEKFKDLFSTPIKKIVWFGANCPISAKKKRVLDYAIKYGNMSAMFEQRAFLQNTLIVRCTDCLDAYIMKKCGSGACIVVPTKNEIIQMKTYEDLFQNLDKYMLY